MQNTTETRPSFATRRGRGPVCPAALRGCFFMAERRLSVGIGNKLPNKKET